MATGHRLGTIFRSSDIVRFVQGGVVKTFRYPPQVDPIPSIKDTIQPLVRELSSLDPRRRVFGAKPHNYRFNKPLKPRRVADFESQHGFQLPADYREFVLTVGDGGAGPHYGIKSLAEASKYSELNMPFPWSTEVTLSTDAEYDLWETYPGVLVIAERGCGYYDVLVVNGDANGQIWSDFSSVDCPIRPTHDSFLDWYVEWAQRCINTIKREPLLNQVTVGMTVADLQRILGPDMNRWDSTADLPDSPAYYIGFTNTNASFGMDENDRVEKINKMKQV